MKRKQLPIIFALLLLLSACSQNGNVAPQRASNSGEQGPTSVDQQPSTTKAPPADVVRVSTNPAEVKAGSSGEATIKLTVAQGYHINANPPSFPYLKATEINVAPAEGISPGKPIYPKAVTRKFAFSNDPLSVYEGETAIKLPLNVPGGLKGSYTLPGKLRIQACDEEACYPPRILDIAVTVAVK